LQLSTRSEPAGNRHQRRQRDWHTGRGFCLRDGVRASDALAKLGEVAEVKTCQKFPALFDTVHTVFCLRGDEGHWLEMREAKANYSGPRTTEPEIRTGLRLDFGRGAPLRYSLQRGMQLRFQAEQREIALEQIGEQDNRRLLFWEAAEGGNGIWQRLIEDSNALARVAEKALDICHFDCSTGNELPGWAERSSRACYDCLLSYSNQPSRCIWEVPWTRGLIPHCETLEQDSASASNIIPLLAVASG